ncbi:hypothetical protein MPSEU_000950500 [Mayamaea pseudoterrestris]|nr:hypothetical protein MPSEU_000950500 [Mayamaea pseudoterrestris]
MGLIRYDEAMPPSEDRSYNSFNSHVPNRSVTMAVNYELSSRFKAVDHKARRESLSSPNTGAALPNVENDAPNLPTNDATVTAMMALHKNETCTRETPDKIGSSLVKVEKPLKASMRRSPREKKRETVVIKSRVRYDMLLVPPARRHAAFLKRYPLWWLAESQSQLAAVNKTRRADENYPPCDRCDGPALSPFTEDTSVIWVPKTRAEWEDSVSEMTAVCTSAAIRRYHLQEPSDKPFYPPLSADYIRDRVDIDDPLYGYQLRHKSGGWLQGFVLFTNFTVWTHNFHWDSTHESSGIDQSNQFADADGAMARELENEEHVGDPHDEGIVFPTIAEIALVGGLACGEYMLRMAMDRIRAAGRYKYVVLQSTEQSKTFYERFGFIRVGAICQYDLPDAKGLSHGYRHWTHANESETSLELHGGPSYMMCLKLPDANKIDSCLNCGRSIAESNSYEFLKAMLSLEVAMKPTVEQLGAAFSPVPKQRRNSSIASGNGELLDGLAPKRGRGRPKGSKNKSNIKASTKHVSAKRKFDAKDESIKRQKTDVPSHDFPLIPPGSTSVSTPITLPDTWFEVGSKNDTSNKESSQSVTQSPCRARRSKSQGQIKTSAMLCDENIRPTGFARGDGGRFVTVPNLSSAQQHSSISPRKSSTRSIKSRKATPKATFPPATTPKQGRDVSFEERSIGFGRADGKPTSINRNELFKQRAKIFPRNREHFYNRVVKPLRGPTQYYYVLHYDESTRRMRIAPMESRSLLAGHRAGRPRYQVVVEDTDANFLTVDADDFVVVPSSVVMRTPVIATEAWDIQDDS